MGVCDVWRLELSAEQWPWLLDELDEVRGPLEEELQRARAQHAVDDGAATVDEAAALEYELRLVRRMRAQLPAIDNGEAVTFVGPAELVRELVRDVLGKVVDALSDRLRDLDPTNPERRARLVCTAAAAAAWTRTFVECSELEGFSFDPDADPVSVR